MTHSTLPAITPLLALAGIEGLEGKQASMAADFSIGRFKHLVRLLFVHGHWSYDRLAVMTLYNFFKNSVSASFSIVQISYSSL